MAEENLTPEKIKKRKNKVRIVYADGSSRISLNGDKKINTGGRPYKWETNEDLFKDWNKYIDFCRTGWNPAKRVDKQGNVVMVPLTEPPSIEGFADFLEMSPMTFYRAVNGADETKRNLTKNEDKRDLREGLARIRAAMKRFSNTFTANGIFNPQWYILYAKNEMDYTDKQTNELKTDMSLSMSDEDKQLIQKAMELLNKKEKE